MLRNFKNTTTLVILTINFLNLCLILIYTYILFFLINCLIICPRHIILFRILYADDVVTSLWLTVMHKTHLLIWKTFLSSPGFEPCPPHLFGLPVARSTHYAKLPDGKLIDFTVIYGVKRKFSELTIGSWRSFVIFVMNLILSLYFGEIRLTISLIIIVLFVSVELKNNYFGRDRNLFKINISEILYLYIRILILFYVVA